MVLGLGSRLGHMYIVERMRYMYNVGQVYCGDEENSNLQKEHIFGGWGLILELEFYHCQ